MAQESSLRRQLRFIAIGVMLRGGTLAVLAKGQPRHQSLPVQVEMQLGQERDRRVPDNVSSLLLHAVKQIETAEELAVDHPLVRVDATRKVQTYLYVTTFGEVEQAALEALGVEIEAVSDADDLVQAWVPIEQLENIAALGFVQRVMPPPYATLQQGSVTTVGDTILAADKLRELGFDGRGAKVAVIADGAANYRDAVATGDLPPGLAVFGACIPTPAVTCKLGTAILEVVHDLAPGAELAIGALDFSRGVTPFDLLRRIREVVEQFEADIVVHALQFFQEPYFADGLVAQGVARAVDDDVIYIAPAGDEAQAHYEADFVNTPTQDLAIHDFGLAAGQTSDTTMGVQVEPRASITLWLQWNDPFGQSGNNYNLFLMDETGRNTLASGSERQDGDDDPREVVRYTNPTDRAIQLQVLIGRPAGTDRRLEMFIEGGARLLEYGVPDGSVFGAAAVPGVLTVGATPAQTPDEIEPFSARGPSLISLPVSELRPKPDVVGIDRTTVTAGNGFSGGFIGTTAAAAHAAGIAALLREAVPTAAGKDISSAMIAGAVDLGEPGRDTTFGAGRLDAVAAFATFSNIAPEGSIDQPPGDVRIAPGESVAFAATGTDPDGHVPLSFQWDFGGAAPALTIEDPGPVTFNTAGTYNVKLTVQDRLGLADPAPAMRVVRVMASPPPPPPPPPPPSNMPPDGAIDTPQTGVRITVGETVHFTATGTDPDGPNTLSFQWDFGGGATNRIQEDPGPVTFQTAGSYTVRLTVVDNMGLADPTPASRLVVVTEPN